jgi:hypothetical protein
LNLIYSYLNYVNNDHDCVCDRVYDCGYVFFVRFS